MSFGAIQGALASLRNNERLRKRKKEHFDRNSIIGSYAKSEKPEYDFPKATPQMLRAIRERLLFENEQRKKRRLIALAFTLVSIITISVIILA